MWMVDGKRKRQDDWEKGKKEKERGKNRKKEPENFRGAK
jgi:hypothetical protein